MLARRIDLFTLFGIAIRIDPSWFIVVVLVSWSLAERYFPGSYPGLARSSHWLMGVAGALGLFVSVILHELGHALMARRHGLAIRGITLFIFGGVAEMESEPPSPKAEFAVAVAGPAVSILLGVGCFVVNGMAWLVLGSFAVSGVLAYLALINLVLVGFNLIPAFPLDGGRVLRSLLWRWKRNLRWATEVTSRIGSGFGVVLIALGLFELLARGDLVGGMWLCLIGLFLRNAAQMSYRQVVLRRRFEGQVVRSFMQADPVAVPRAVSISELVRDYVSRDRRGWFAVVDNGRLIGCVDGRRVEALPRSEWDRQSVGTITVPCSESNTVTADGDALQALALMTRSGVSRLPVVEAGELVGTVTMSDLFDSLRAALGGRDPAVRLTVSNWPG